MYFTKYANTITDADGVEDSSGYPLYLYEEEVSAGYVDITSVTNLDLYGSQLGFDYEYLKSIIKDLVDLTGFTALALSEQRIAAKYSLGTYAERLEALGGDSNAVKELAIADKYGSLESREQRLERISAICNYHFDGVMDGDIPVAFIFGAEVEAYYFSYYHFNSIGTVDGGVTEGLSDYLDSKAGTSWESTGLRSKGWIPSSNLTLDEVADVLLSVLEKGYDIWGY